MAKYLITGGSGFIGGHFLNVLPNNEVTILDLQEPQKPYNSMFIQGDIRRSQDVENAIEKNNIEIIISLAAMHHDFGITEQEYYDTNEKGTQVICEAASNHNIKTIIFYSSVAVYGDNIEPSHELMEPQPSNPYGASKLAGEKVLIKWASEDKERKVLIIRPALVFGINNVANMYKLIHQINKGIYFHLGKADNIKSIAYVNNLVEATLWAWKRLEPGVTIYNYADEPQLTSHQIAETIATTLNKKIRVTLPKKFGILLGLPFDLLIKLTGKNLPISTNRIKKLATETHHSSSKIFTDGFKPKYSTKDGLVEMVKWYKTTNA